MIPLGMYGAARPVAAGGAYILRDTFDRANAASLGTADVGGAWSLQSGSFQIVNNQARATSLSEYGTTSSATALLNAGVGDYTASLDVTYGSWASITFRVQDPIKKYALAVSSVGLRIIKWPNNIFPTTLATYSFTPTAGAVYTLRVELSGSSIVGYLNGVQRVTATQSDYAGATNVGLYIADTTSLLDNFTVEA